MKEITWEHFDEIELRVGKIAQVDDFPEARKPAYKVKVYFGVELGTKQSSAQLTHYTKEELLGTQVVCVCNFPKKQICPVMSEVLILGLPSDRGVSLLRPDFMVPLGGRVY